MKRHDKLAETIPVGNLGILALESSREMGNRVNDYIVEWVRSVPVWKHRLLPLLITVRILI